jgi:competence protein ComGC
VNNSKKISFSLMEVLVVICIFSILIILTFPMILNEKCYLDSDVNNIHTTFIYLQQRTLASNKNNSLSIDTKNNCLSFKKNNSSIIIKLHHAITFGFLKNISGPPGKATKIIKKSHTFPSNKVTFYNNGNISPGSLYFITKSKKYMRAITISVSGFSMPKKYEYYNYQWREY